MWILTKLLVFSHLNWGLTKFASDLAFLISPQSRNTRQASTYVDFQWISKLYNLFELVSDNCFQFVFHGVDKLLVSMVIPIQSLDFIPLSFQSMVWPFCTVNLVGLKQGYWCVWGHCQCPFQSHVIARGQISASSILIYWNWAMVPVIR